MKKRKMHKAPSVISVDLKSHKSRVIKYTEVTDKESEEITKTLAYVIERRMIRDI